MKYIIINFHLENGMYTIRISEEKTMVYTSDSEMAFRIADMIRSDYNIKKENVIYRKVSEDNKVVNIH